MQVYTPPVSLGPVLEKLATSERVTITIERLPDGKMRVTSNSWDHERVLSKDQILEIRNARGRLHIARKSKHLDAWDPPIEPYDPYGPSVSQRAASDFDVITDEEIDASTAESTRGLPE